jgi:manganese transport protein
VTAATDVLEGRTSRRGARQLLPFMGPAFVAAVAYVDPGNFATNIEGGAKFGYMLVWVIVASNLMAMLIQTLSAKLGIATGRNLAEVIRDEYPRWAVWGFWVIGEMVAIATDLAEFLGAALGFYLLFGMPLLPAGILTGIVTFAILALQRYGFRLMEAIITSLVGVIAVSYLVELVLGRPDWGAIGMSFVPPRFSGTEGVLLATGILGATVMPHVIYLHSALTQGRIVVREPRLLRRLYRYERIDVAVAMGLAGLINAAMLIMAAATFHQTGLTEVATIEEAHRTLTPLLGSASSVIFGISLLASGLSSSAVGTMSGQVIMQGFLHTTIPIWVRRLITMAPALLVIGIGLNPTRTLILSQVILSFAIPFALLPLVSFTHKQRLMGPLVNRRITTIVAGIMAALIICLNLFLLYQTFIGGD